MKAIILNLTLSLIYFILNIKHSNCQIEYSLIGGVTDSSFLVKAKVSSSNGSAIEVFVNETKTAVMQKVDDQGHYFANITGLKPDTAFKLELFYNDEFTQTKYIKTFPARYGVFSFIASAYSKSDSSHFVYEKIFKERPNFFLQLGDIHTDDINSENTTDYDKAYQRGKMLILF